MDPLILSFFSFFESGSPPLRCSPPSLTKSRSPQSAEVSAEQKCTLLCSPSPSFKPFLSPGSFHLQTRTPEVTLILGGAGCFFPPLSLHLLCHQPPSPLSLLGDFFPPSCPLAHIRLACLPLPEYWGCDTAFTLNTSGWLLPAPTPPHLLKIATGQMCKKTFSMCI